MWWEFYAVCAVHKGQIWKKKTNKLNKTKWWKNRLPSLQFCPHTLKWKNPSVNERKSNTFQYIQQSPVYPLNGLQQITTAEKKKKKNKRPKYLKVLLFLCFKCVINTIVCFGSSLCNTIALQRPGMIVCARYYSTHRFYFIYDWMTSLSLCSSLCSAVSGLITAVSGL